MSNELNIKIPGVSGATVSAVLVTAGAVVGTSISLSAVSGETDLYTGNMPSVGAAVYTINYTVVTGGVTWYWADAIAWDGTKEVTAIVLQTDIGSGGGGGGGGTGSVPVTITVTDGTNPIQAANVNLLVNASHYFVLTNSSGVAVLTPNEGGSSGTPVVYTVQITASGYQFTPTTLTVAGATSHTYAMSQISITPSTLPLVTGYLVAYDSAGNALAGVSHTVRYVAPPVGDTGSSFPKLPTWDVSTGSNGVAQWVGLIAGAQYTVRRGTGPEVPFTASTSGTFKLPDCSG